MAGTVISVRHLTVALASMCSCLGTQAVGADDAMKVRFNEDVRPILVGHCSACHGLDKAEGGFRLTDRASALAELDSGARAIVPGDTAASELLNRVSAADPALRMPPQGDPLSSRQIETLRRWITEGASWEPHWAYRPIMRPALPAVRQETWVQSPIDRFVLAPLEARGISPSPDASRQTLIKRLYYDLLGLLPPANEVDEFVTAADPQAYSQLVDRLLASPHFGERWGRHWLDKARYADSDGYEKDSSRPDAWRYRDWVIDAVNRDMPFDRFTIQQLAGDLLPDATAATRLATAFHRQTLTNAEGGVDPEQFRVEAVFDRTETTGTVWLGLTVGCARCHSHKYDQISQTDYYRLFAFFNNADETQSQVVISPAAEARYEREIAAHRDDLVKAEADLPQARGRVAERLSEWVEASRAVLSTDPASLPAADVVELSKVTGPEGATFERLADGSYRATPGPKSDTGQYVLQLTIPRAGIAGFRIEALADATLPGGGPGLSASGNFVVTSVELHVTRRTTFQSQDRRILTAAASDFAQTRWPADGVLDNSTKTGWAISPHMGQNHWLEVAVATPLVLVPGRQVQLVIDQQYGKGHWLGRFRVLAVYDSPIMQRLRLLAGKSSAEWTQDDREFLIDQACADDDDAQRTATALAKLRAKMPAPPLMDVRVISERAKNRRRVTHLLHRGEFLQPTEEVAAGGLAALPALPVRDEANGADRLDLAYWLVATENPLPARVAVNDVWTHLFGRGLVSTNNDFGVRAEPPSHPELLDWLAAEFMSQGWSRKQLIRTVVLSAAYRQSSHERTELADLDPENVWLARQRRWRVEGEIVQDLCLAAAGLLDVRIGGPSVFPPLPPGVAELSYAGNFRWQESAGADRHRRGMYTFFKRTAPHPNLIIFDCPDANVTCVKRERSNTPIQALTMLNNAVFVEAARDLAKRFAALPGDSIDAQLRKAWRTCLLRMPTEQEVTQLAQLWRTTHDYYEQHLADARVLCGDADAPADPAASAAWMVVARMVLNLDEFVTRE